MRNLKRALSLALASVMLLGMMVVGTSAASTSNFTDADKISNAEAVDLTTGLDIFKGYTDGSFGPEKAVTRAEAAVVIAKILHGSDVNPANFAGAGKFTDVEAWAEGYVNLVSSLGIIVGRGEGIFDPNATVTTVEFSTMLLKALGYYVEADALGADWMLEVTSKANALGLYGDLELAMTAPLTRENVAVMTMNALFAQRVAYDDVRGLYVKNSDRNVVVTNGTVDELNTLAQNTYGLYAVEGMVTENGMTNMVLEGKTLVVFDDEKDVTGDKVTEDEYSFKAETGLDMIGHAVTVYYTIEKKAPVVYAIVDEATLAVDAVLTDNLSTLAKDEGFAKDTSKTEFAYNYDLESAVVTDKNYKGFAGQIVKLISNSADLTVDYAIVVESKLDYVKSTLINDADKDDVITTYTMVGNDAHQDDKDIIAVNEVEEKDYVLVTKIANRDVDGTGDLYLIEAAETEIENIVKVTRKLDNTTKLASEAVDYTESAIAIVADLKVALNTAKDGYVAADDEDVIAYEDVLMKGEYVLIYDTVDRLIGVVPVEIDSTVNAAYVAQFGVKINTDPSLYDKYALYAHIYFADGTNGIYTVETGNKTGNAFYGKAYGNETFAFNSAKDTYVLADADGKDEGLNEAKEGFGPYIKLYDVTIQSNGKALIKELPNQKGAWDKNNEYFVLGNDAGTTKVSAVMKQIKNGVTMMGNESSGSKSQNYYGNSGTTFFFVEGTYTEDGIDVDVITGMKNVPTVELLNTYAMSEHTESTADDAYLNQATAIQKTGYKAVEYVLVNGYDFVEAIDGLYYYDEVYTVTDMKDGTFDLTFTVYEFETGEKTTITYEGFKSDALARAAAKALVNGYYTEGTTASTTLDAYAVKQPAVNNIIDDTTKYVVDAKFQALFNNEGDTLTLYTSLNETYGGVTVDEETILVDLTNNNLSGSALTKLEAMNSLIEARAKIYKLNDAETNETATLVYDINKDNTVGVIYIVDILGVYTPDYTGNGTQTPETTKAVSLDKSGAVVANFAAQKYVATLYEYSPYQGQWIAVDADEYVVGVDTGDLTFDLVPGYRYKVIVNGVESNIVLAEANAQ